MSNDSNVQGNRIYWADTCRIIATFGVILIHVSAPVFYNYHSAPLDFFLSANLLDSFARVSVPLFVMLSGSLLLQSTHTAIMIWRRVIKILIPMIVWSLIYLSWNNNWIHNPFSLSDAFYKMLAGPVIHHLWFAYMIIGIYILLPILKLISIALNQHKYFALYFFILWFIINSITVYFPLVSLNSLNLSNFLGWPGIFLLGRYINTSNYFLKLSRPMLLSLYITASLTTFFLTWIFMNDSSVPDETAYNYLSPNVVIASISAFIFIKSITIPMVMHKTLKLLSGLTFTVYLMHLLVIELLSSGFFGITITSYSIHPFIGIIVLSFATFIISLLIASMSRLIPKIDVLIG
jgi:surface polysaccharide O-acyltransferase-like enzyme